MNYKTKILTPEIMSSKLLMKEILAFLEDHKIVDALLINLKGKSAMAEAMIVASGRSQKHISVAAELLKNHLKEQRKMSVMIEGLHCSDWILIDAGDVIVHLFKPETRSLYGLEKMWGDS